MSKPNKPSWPARLWRKRWVRRVVMVATAAAFTWSCRLWAPGSLGEALCQALAPLFPAGS